MAQRGGGLFSGLKDSTQRNRNMILYLLLLAAHLGAAGSWLTLPDQVTMMGTVEGQKPLYLSRIIPLGITHSSFSLRISSARFS